MKTIYRYRWKYSPANDWVYHEVENGVPASLCMGLTDMDGALLYEGDVVSKYGSLYQVKYGSYRYLKQAPDNGIRLNDFGWYLELISPFGEYAENILPIKYAINGMVSTTPIIDDLSDASFSVKKVGEL